MTKAQPLRPSWRAWLRHGLLALLGLGLIALYVLRADPGEVFEAIASVPLWVPALSASLFGAVWVLRVWSLRFLSQQTQGELSWDRANQAFLGSNVLNLVLPARLGDAALIVAMSEEADAGEVASLVLHWRVQSLIALGVLAGAIAILAARAPPSSGLIAYALVLAVFLPLLLAGAFLVALLGYGGGSQLARASQALQDRFAGQGARGRWTARLHRVVESGRTLFDVRILAPALLMAGLGWYLEILVAVPFVVVLAPGISPYLAMAAPIAAALVGVVRILPGSFGIYEGAFAAVLIGGGVVPAAAVAAGAAAHGFVTLILLLAGIPAAVALSRRTTRQAVSVVRDRLDRSDHELPLARDPDA